MISPLNSSKLMKCLMRFPISWVSQSAWSLLGNPTTKCVIWREQRIEVNALAAWLRFWRKIGSRGKIMPSTKVASPIFFTPTSQASV